MNTLVRPATPDDLDAIGEIERASFSIPWSVAAIAEELRRDDRHLPLVLESDGETLGFALVWRILDELHLINFAIKPEYRRRGYAKVLLRAVFELAGTHRARLITLEVREGNEAARQLYRTFGFTEVALRPRYYPDTREDAVIMLRELEGPAGGD